MTSWVRDGSPWHVGGAHASKHCSFCCEHGKQRPPVWKQDVVPVKSRWNAREHAVGSSLWSKQDAVAVRSGSPAHDGRGTQVLVQNPSLSSEGEHAG